ncbi:MAG: YheU family protein [Myxococcota bacterium]|nr:YheU family protein [Myxococcota bacterium]
MVIPHSELAPDTLSRLIESFVLREGTDYGDYSTDLEQKVSQVRMQLEKGEAVIVYRADDQSISIVVKDGITDE